MSARFRFGTASFLTISTQARNSFCSGLLDVVRHVLPLHLASHLTACRCLSKWSVWNQRLPVEALPALSLQTVVYCAWTSWNGTLTKNFSFFYFWGELMGSRFWLAVKERSIRYLLLKVRGSCLHHMLLFPKLSQCYIRAKHSQFSVLYHHSYKCSVSIVSQCLQTHWNYSADPLY